MLIRVKRGGENAVSFCGLPPAILTGLLVVFWTGATLVQALAESSSPPLLAVGGLVQSDDDAFFLTSPANAVKEESQAENGGFTNREAFASLGRHFAAGLESPGAVVSGNDRNDGVASARFEFVTADCGSREVGLRQSPAYYSTDKFSEQAWSAKYELVGMYAAVSIVGFANWDWFSSGFRFNNEGWFNEDRTGSGGMDKVGHAFATYVMTDILTHAIRRNSGDPRGGEITAALLACSVMTYVEVFDGFSGDHGFSYEDLVMDVLGAGFSALRNSVPGLREKIDFRMQYLPSAHSSLEPFADYSGQKYFMVVKLAGFERFRETPLRFVELHGGYCARGFSDEEERAGDRHERNLYVGIGLNLQELLFGKVDKDREHWAAKTARVSLEYVQIPYTYVSTGGNSGR
ncbi:MAG: DUF2279 domain-containing protein [Verrucomicrobiota bacterium]